MTLAIGEIFDSRYLLRELVAESERGAIYLAKHEFLHRDVAIHIARRLDSEQSENLRTEAQRLDDARHVRVLRVIDVSETPDGDVYMITDPIGGKALDTVLAKRGTLLIEEAVTVALQLASALSAAHQAKVFHAGLGPASVQCIEHAGAVVGIALLDFGVWPSPLGAMGGPLGAMAYAAPERFSGGGDDPRNDVHALAALLYEMMCGELPARDMRTPDMLAGMLPRGLADVVGQALAPAAARFASMNAFSEALRRATILTRETPADPIPAPPRNAQNEPIPRTTPPSKKALDLRMAEVATSAMVVTSRRMAEASGEDDGSGGDDDARRGPIVWIGEDDEPDSEPPLTKQTEPERPEPELAESPAESEPEAQPAPMLDWESSPEPMASGATATPPDLPPPSEVLKDGGERRSMARVGYVTPVRVRRAGGDALDGRTRNISETGTNAHVSGEVDVGETVLLRFSLPGSGRVVSVSAVSRWVTETAGRRTIGLEFEEPGEKIQLDIRGYVDLMGGHLGR